MAAFISLILSLIKYAVYFWSMIWHTIDMNRCFDLCLRLAGCKRIFIRFFV